MRVFTRVLFKAVIAFTALTAQCAFAGEPGAKPSGEAVFEHWCLPCHGAGPHHPATASLEFKYKGSKPAALQERTDLTPEIVRHFVRHGAGNMAPFRKTEITDAELDALADYLSHAAPAR